MQDSYNATPRRNLVIVRAGANTLHRKWLQESRNWDLAVSSFDCDRIGDFPEAEHFHYYKGGKWDGLNDFLKVHRSVLDNYEYFWLPDDDIETDGATINRIFDLARVNQLELCQPSLLDKSYFWHPITLQCPFTIIRYTNFVEVMVPMMRINVLRGAMQFFERTQSGWGLDQFWARLTSDTISKCAILDEVAVYHTRKVGSALAKVMEDAGLSGHNEMDNLDREIGVSSLRPVCFRAKTRWGTMVKGPKICGLVQFVGQAPWLSNGRHWWNGPRVFGGSLLSHLRISPNLSKL